MKKIVSIGVAVPAALLLGGAVRGDVIRVPDDTPSVQLAINASEDGDTVLVEEGVYYENINFHGKAITVRSINPSSLKVVAATILDGDRKNRVATFDSGENPDSVLAGFTLKNGRAERGAGILCEQNSSPTISCNIVTDNEAGGAYAKGGGIYCSHSSPALIANIIEENVSESDGGGVCLYYSDARLKNNTVEFNSAVEIGGGIDCLYSTPLLSNNLIANNSAFQGGGIYSQESDPRMDRCTITDNEASDSGGGFALLSEENFVHPGVPRISNSILGGNEAPLFEDICIIEAIEDPPIRIRYSNVKGGWPGVGNISANPRFVTGEGDRRYCLSQIAAGQTADSACVDAGNPNSPVGNTTTRTDGVPDEGVLDMGFHYPPLD